MAALYTVGHWTVVPGREDDFVAAWSALAQWTADNIPGAQWAKLLQHQDETNRFVSLGPWESADAIAVWRASDGFKARVGAIQELLEGFEPGTFEARAEVGDVS